MQFDEPMSEIKPVDKGPTEPPPPDEPPRRRKGRPCFRTCVLPEGIDRDGIPSCNALF
jgi:hypothetical protein